MIPRSYVLLFTLAFVLRLVIITVTSFIDTLSPHTLNYTDIDYLVFTDASGHILAGNSPFSRHTYRYTPLLSIFMICNHLFFHDFGKIVFSLCDVICGILVVRIRRSEFVSEVSVFLSENKEEEEEGQSEAAESEEEKGESEEKEDTSDLWSVSVWILFNPVLINVSTRGNADILVILMVLLMCWVLQKAKLCFQDSKRTRRTSEAVKYVLYGAFWLGMAIQLKLFPVIYVIPVVGWVWMNARNAVKTWHRVCLICLCGVIVLGLNFAFTFLWWYLYGWKSVEESLLYHLIRSDVRHNLSPYFYSVYIGGIQKSSILAWAMFLPQVFLLLVNGAILSRWLGLAMVVQTMLFVAFNKVCTVQYFVWFLPLLALLRLGGSWKEWLVVGFAWVSSLGHWMLQAYRLEFLGENTFLLVWFAGLLFLIANSGLVVMVLQKTRGGAVPVAVRKKKTS